MKPVSICLTTYNRASVLRQTLESILDQTFSDFELIVSDDCSTDDTRQICLEYAGHDKRVCYYRNQKNLNMPGNLNAALSEARGEYIANLHDGDVYRPDLIEKWKKALDNTREAPFVFNAYRTILRSGRSRLNLERGAPVIPGSYIATHYFRTLTSCVWGTVMARASAYSEAGPFDSSFGFISDVDMWLRLAHGATVAYVPEPLITLTPREPRHPYARVSWQYVFWGLQIYRKHLRLYQDIMPHATAFYEARLGATVRAHLLTSMLALIRRAEVSRIAEGLSIWRDAHDPFIRIIGRWLGHPRFQPAWYDESYWGSA